MKKLITFTAIIMVFVLITTGCEIGNTLTDKLEDSAKSPEKIENMLSALCEGRIDDAKGMMHPTATENVEASLNSIIDYLDSRTIKQMSLEGLNVHSSIGTDGNVLEEDMEYLVTLSDGEVIHISSVYISDNHGEGFIKFGLIIGVF